MNVRITVNMGTASSDVLCTNHACLCGRVTSLSRSPIRRWAMARMGVVQKDGDGTPYQALRSAVCTSAADSPAS